MKVSPYDMPEMGSEIEVAIPLHSVYLFNGKTGSVVSGNPDAQTAKIEMYV